MELGGLQCHGCGSSNVVFDPKGRILKCSQCGKEEYYSRATLNANGKVLFSKENAINFFTEGKFENSQHYAMNVLNISKDNAPALYIMAYFDEFVSRKDGALKSFFHEIQGLALEYDEVQELKKLFLASAYNLLDYESEVLTLIAVNMQSEDDSEDLCKFVDTLCPYLIKKRTSINFLTSNLVGIYEELAGHCDIPKTCFALLKAIDENPDSPYKNNSFYLRSNAKYFYDNFVLTVGKIINAMKTKELRDKFFNSYTKKRVMYEERTALTMALICRRNNKIQTCYEWLSIYFANQDAANFSEGSFTYIDAYVNGVFGPDDKHMCSDYITKWINEIRGSSSLFEKEQEKLWNEYCNKFQKGIEEEFPDLKDSVQEYDRVNDYVSRINSVEDITDNFTGIVNAYVDQERLKAMIDKNLISLVSRYDEAEEPLRKEEKYLIEVKKHEGDTDAAKEAIIAAERLRQVKALNLVEQMTRVIRSEGDVSPSEKKTAVSFLRGYINKGFNTYITEKKADFPESITMNINGWIGSTTDGSNSNHLLTDYDEYLSKRCNQEIVEATTIIPRYWMIGSILLGIFTLIMLIVALPIGVISLLGTGACIYMAIKSKKDIDANIKAINNKYTDMSIQGKDKIEICINQWNRTKSIVNQFINEPITDIIA